jgi:hypothetical protein
MEFGRFAKQAGDWLSREVVEALASSLFEGEILCSGINLQANRREFEVNQSLVGFCAAVDGWWKKIGKDHYQEVRDEAKSERYHNLTLRSLSVLEAIFKTELGDRLRELVQTFKVGTIGKRHTELDVKKVIGCDVPGTSVHGREQPSGKKDSDNNEGTREPREPEQEHEEHVPLVVQGPSGRPRRVVSKNSLGIKILHDEMPGYDRLWKFNEANGQLIFNIRHPQWEALENNDNALMRLMEHVLCQVLSLYSLDAEFRPAGEILLEVLEPYLVFLLSEADRYANRGPGRRNKS